MTVLVNNQTVLAPGFQWALTFFALSNTTNRGFCWFCYFNLKNVCNAVYLCENALRFTPDLLRRSSKATHIKPAGTLEKKSTRINRAFTSHIMCFIYHWDHHIVIHCPFVRLLIETKHFGVKNQWYKASVVVQVQGSLEVQVLQGNCLQIFKKKFLVWASV